MFAFDQSLSTFSCNKGFSESQSRLFEKIMEVKAEEKKCLVSLEKAHVLYNKHMRGSAFAEVDNFHQNLKDQAIKYVILVPQSETEVSEKGENFWEAYSPKQQLKQLSEDPSLDWDKLTQEHVDEIKMSFFAVPGGYRVYQELNPTHLLGMFRMALVLVAAKASYIKNVAV